MPPEEFPPEPAPWHERALAVAYVMVPVIRFMCFIIGVPPAIFLYVFYGYSNWVLGFALVAVFGFVFTTLILMVGAAKIAENEELRLRDEKERGA